MKNQIETLFTPSQIERLRVYFVKTPVMPATAPAYVKKFLFEIEGDFSMVSPVMWSVFVDFFRQYRGV